MAVETKGINCPTGAYTLLADGKTNVTIKFRTVGNGRLAIATSLPDTSTEDYMTINSTQPVELGNMVTGDKVYFMPNTEGELLEVLRG